MRQSWFHFSSSSLNIIHGPRPLLNPIRYAKDESWNDMDPHFNIKYFIHCKRVN